MPDKARDGSELVLGLLVHPRQCLRKIAEDVIREHYSHGNRSFWTQITSKGEVLLQTFP